jgi:hypothetical protein
MEWHDGAGLDAEFALTHPRNKQHLQHLNIEMDPEKDSFLSHNGRLGPLPARYRTVKWEIRKTRNNSKESKKKDEKREGAASELAEPSGSAEGTECGSVDYAAAVGATDALPESVKDYIGGLLTALASAKQQSQPMAPRASGPGGKVMLWDTNTIYQQYRGHYAAFPEPTMCPSTRYTTTSHRTARR